MPKLSNPNNYITTLRRRVTERNEALTAIHEVAQTLAVYLQSPKFDSDDSVNRNDILSQLLDIRNTAAAARCQH